MDDTTNESEQSDIVSDPRVQIEIATPESVSWPSFDGNEGLSSHEFVQKVQRTAFQQGKQREDDWVADFVATCLSGEALEWYIGLDEETQTSWRKLRAGLIQRWSIQSGKASSARSDVNSANLPAPAPATTPPHSLPRTSNKILRGIIKVAVTDTQSLGYITLDAEGTCIIQKDAALALVVGRPQQLNPAAPCQISIEGPEDVKASIAHMPYLGLSLHRPLGKDPDTVPSEMPRGPNGTYKGHPIPSSLCSNKRHGSTVHPLATWYISPCPKDPPGPWRKRTLLEPSVPAAAVFAWTLDPTTLELGTTWLMPDGSLYDLETLVDNTKINSKLHMHRKRDNPVGAVEDIRVRLYYTPV